MRPTIFLYDTLCDKAKEILEEVAEITTRLSEPSDIIWTGLNPVNSDGVVACPCTGIDHINAEKVIYLDEEWKRTEGQQVTSTAEHTWSLILQLAKMKRMQLSGKTIGIIGYGRIGQQIKEYAEAFKMNVLVADKNKTKMEEVFHNQELDLDDVLLDSDIITLHVPLNDSTKGMISKEQIAMMKPKALLINTSRQEIIDIDSLRYALFSKTIGGYADDFNGDEHIQVGLDWSPVMQTPHIAGNCIEAREATDIYIAKKTVEFIKETYGNRIL
jgi:phosphoglycerate dehydrogenase-like enzyme